MLKRTEYQTEIPKIDNNFENFKTALNRPTGNFFYDPWEIKDEYKNTVWEKLLKSLPIVHGEARVIVMQPGTTYMAHADIDNRWHLTLQSEQSYLIDLEDKTLYKLNADGCWYYMDAGKIHTASNYGSIPRIQLVVRELLKKTNYDECVSVTIKPSSLQFDYRYKFDNLVSSWLNKSNQNLYIKDFEFKGEVVKFKTLSSVIEDLKLTEDFIIEVESLS